MEPVYRMLFDEARHALSELKGGNAIEAKHTLEGMVLVDEFIRRYRRRDRQALRLAAIVRRLEWEWTPEGRLELERRIDEERRLETAAEAEWRNYLQLQHELGRD